MTRSLPGMQITATIKGVWYAFRSAITGRFVSADEAAKHPDTTIRETHRDGDGPEPRIG